MQSSFLLLSLACHAFAATITSLPTAAPSPASTASASSAASTSSGAASGSYSTRSVFLPISLTEQLAASVVTAAPSSTVYAVSCAASVSNCPVNSAISITEGSDLFAVAAPASLLGRGAGTISLSCELAGGATATAATCTAASVNSGLSLATVSTLSASQIYYVPLTITAGQNELASVTSGAAGSSSTGAAGRVMGGGYAAAAVPVVIGGVAAAFL
ncbi:hypothetical protein BDY17DRAFT_312788 [Neohortaea acidophila]|uniref:GPI anchored protein n=1 Tax=Neohortaea acidophila TaxID=245834 RepID=A0A6A6PIK7_9PEZI|nr:uncharacterized protein BDY17DRAFT_312788 [Neohortaea acidophila]KAF2479849.1 hypothetical protein BDY17DRAFT_312788 [Neohortaea acidophila]